MANYCRGGLGAAAGVVNYAVNTPRDKWTWEGGGKAAIGGAVAGVIMVRGGRFLNSRYPL